MYFKNIDNWRTPTLKFAPLKMWNFQELSALRVRCSNVSIHQCTFGKRAIQCKFNCCLRNNCIYRQRYCKMLLFQIRGTFDPWNFKKLLNFTTKIPFSKYVWTVFIHQLWWCQSFATSWEISHTYMFRLDGQKSGKNTCVHQCCHITFSRF